ncbi:MAG: CTP:molybdopterin cytidylyltransferase MocA [Sulfitobacter sp.]|jgi:molybdenum cofactor cytidylyltransferase
MAQMLPFPVIVLAAGQSRRMQGRDKLLEDIDGLPLIRHQALKARAVTDAPVIVALPPPPHPRYGALAGLDLHLLPVENPAEGMNASLRSGFAALPDTAQCAMVVLGDLPDLTIADLQRVGQAVDLTSDMVIWRGATQAGAAGHPIVFHRSLFGAIARLHGDGGARAVVARAKDMVMLVPLPGDHARADLDTPEDWRKWRNRRGATD